MRGAMETRRTGSRIFPRVTSAQAFAHRIGPSPYRVTIREADRMCGCPLRVKVSLWFRLLVLAHKAHRAVVKPFNALI